MKPEDVLTIMQLTQPLATIEHAKAFVAVAADRGLTPFQEIYPIFAEAKQKQGNQWVVTGIKSLSFKEHYSVQNRWSQKSGGYSVPYRKTERTTRVNAYGKQESGVEVTVGILTNRDYAALAQLAALRLPGWDFNEERKAFLQYTSAFVPDSHRPPAGWSLEDVARKRAEEQALKKAFGKEPSQSREIYGNAITADARQEAAALMYDEPHREALPAPDVARKPEVVINGDYTEPPADPDYDDQFFDDAQLDADIARAAEVILEAERENPSPPAPKPARKKAAPKVERPADAETVRGWLRESAWGKGAEMRPDSAEVDWRCAPQRAKQVAALFGKALQWEGAQEADLRKARLLTYQYIFDATVGSSHDMSENEAAAVIRWMGGGWEPMEPALSEARFLYHAAQVAAGQQTLPL